MDFKVVNINALKQIPTSSSGSKVMVSMSTGDSSLPKRRIKVHFMNQYTDTRLWDERLSHKGIIL